MARLGGAGRGMELYKYQEEGADWLAGRRYALLADEMGLGKTLQAIVGALRAGIKHVLVICPAVTVPQWEWQLRKWTDGQVKGTVVSYEYASKNHELFALLKWELLILDEAHFVKSIDAQRAKYIVGKGGIIHASKRAWLLTGTPMQNHPGELWVIARVLGATQLTHDEWLRKFCKVRITPWGAKPVGAKREAMPELRQIMNRFTKRRRWKDVDQQISAVNIDTVVVPAGPVDMIEHFPAYQNAGKTIADVRKEMAAEMEALGNSFIANGMAHDDNEAFDQLAAKTKATATLRRFIGLQKVQGLCDILTAEADADPRYKCVVFFQHKAVVEEARLLLPSKIGMKAIYGGSKPEKRAEHIRQFIEKPTRNHVLLIQTQVGGTGFDGLQAVCNQAIMLEPSWVPGENAQCIGRLARIGQKRPVFVRFIALANTLDRRITEVNARKTADINLAGLGD